MNLFNKNKILEIDSLIKLELKSAFNNPFKLISYSTTDNNSLHLHYTYDNDNIKILFDATKNNKITKIHIFNPSNNKISDSYVAFCSKLVDLPILEYTDFQKMEAQIQMITPVDVEKSTKTIGKTVIKSTYIGQKEDISAVIKILE